MMNAETLWLRVENRILRGRITDAFAYARSFRDCRFADVVRHLAESPNIDDLGFPDMESAEEYYRRAAPHEVTNALYGQAVFRGSELFGHGHGRLLKQRMRHRHGLYIFWHELTPVYVGMTRKGIRRVLATDHPVRATISRNRDLLDDLWLYWYTTPTPKHLGQLEYAVERALKPAWNGRHRTMKDYRRGMTAIDDDERYKIDWDWQLPGFSKCLEPIVHPVDPTVAEFFAKIEARGVVI